MVDEATKRAKAADAKVTRGLLAAVGIGLLLLVALACACFYLPMALKTLLFPGF